MDKYYSVPVETQAIQFTGSNGQEIVSILKLNKAHAELRYVDEYGRFVPPNRITTQKVVTISVGDGQFVIVNPTDWIIKGDNEFYPVPDELFKRYYVRTSGEISDGYHSFNALYDHRIELWIAVCKLFVKCAKLEYKFDVRLADQSVKVWRSRLHSDGSHYDGWFLLGIEYSPGTQMTYHLPISRWDDCDFAIEIEKAPEFDGHTPEDVIERLKHIDDFLFRWIELKENPIYNLSTATEEVKQFIKSHSIITTHSNGKPIHYINSFAFQL